MVPQEMRKTDAPYNKKGPEQRSGPFFHGDSSELLYDIKQLNLKNKHRVRADPALGHAVLAVAEI